MNKYCDIIEYDKIGRVLFVHIKSVEMKYFYKYNDDDTRVCKIYSKNNKSNYKTVLFQSLTKENEYIDNKTIQEGDIYNVEIAYDNLGQESELKRINKKRNTEYKKITFRNSFGAPMIWVEEYNKSRNIIFKVDLDKIKNKA
tara:strand:- start:154 stop:579 length:426 start_codon:yes stop_codon:yes gene_type:complete